MAVCIWAERRVYESDLLNLAGLAIGVKKLQVVFVLRNPQGLRHPSTEAGSPVGRPQQPFLPARAEQGPLAVSPGVWTYQLTEKRLAAVRGTKYWRDSKLNES